jgi:hypothetical protein
MKRRSRLWSPALALFLAAAACGDDATPPEGEPPADDDSTGGAGAGGRGGAPAGGGTSGSAGGAAGAVANPGGNAGAGGAAAGGTGGGGAAGGAMADAAAPVPPPDAAAPADGGKPDAGAVDVSPGAADGGAGAAKFACTQFMGPNITAEWFRSGFEPAGEKDWNDAWQVKAPHASFADLWADPNNSVWRAPVESACAAGRKVDRVVFVTQLSDWSSNNVGRWKTAIGNGIKTIKAKYPELKRVDLVTFYRSKDNKPCPSPKETWVPAAHDEAHQQLAAESNGFVVVGPMVKVDCSMFAGPPYLTTAGKRYVAGEYRKHYVAP